MEKIKNIILQIENLKSKRKYQEAINILENSITKYNDDYRLYEELADIFIYKGNLNKAYKAIKYAIEINTESATGNYLMGFILLSKQKIDEAIVFLEKSNKLLGNNSEVLRNLGWAYSLKGDFPKGISILKRALIISPGDNLIMEDLAMAYISSGDIKEGNSILKEIGKEELIINN